MAGCLRACRSPGQGYLRPGDTAAIDTRVLIKHFIPPRRSAAWALCLLAGSALGAAGSARAQPAPGPMAAAKAPAAPLAISQRPHLRAMRTDKPPILDGRLDEAAWQKAPASDAFTEKFPKDGARPLERTVIRFLYDEHALYVGIECEQTQAPVIGRLTRRDRPIEADWVSVGLDSRDDGTTAFEFVVNAAGVLTDGVRFDDTSYSTDWDENWDARTASGPKGWSAELRIPLRVLRFDASRKTQDWGLQVRRYVSARQETDEWAFIPRKAAGEVSRYGRLTNLVGLHAGSPIELRPFLLGKVLRRDAGQSTLAQGTDFSGSLGLDFKWHLTQNLTLDVALNPDFAQVEADQLVFNLTNIEALYPEKRPFFLEGADTFSTSFKLVYTRRIGAPAPAPALRQSPAEQLVDYAPPATIYGAIKLVGTLLPRLTVGLLSAVTGRDDAPVQQPDGSRSDRLAAPATVFNALRLKAALGSNAHVGFLATATNRLEPQGAFPVADPSTPRDSLCPDGALVPLGSRCWHDAYAGSLDARWRSDSGKYLAMAQVVGTLLHGGPPRLQRDGTVVESGALSAGSFLYLGKEGGEPWTGYLGYDGAGRKLDFNDMGYLPRGNYHSLWAELGYRTLAPWWKTLETTTKLGFWQNLSWTGLPLDNGLYLNSLWKLSTFWSVAVETRYVLPYFDDREVGDGTALQHERGVWLSAKLISDPRHVVSGEVSAASFRRPDGDQFTFTGRLTLRLHPQLDLDILPEATYSFGEPRYVGPGPRAGEVLFGRLLGRSLGATLRATFTFTPRLTLQAFTQLFLASRHYWDFSSLSGEPGGSPLIAHLRDLRPAAAPSANPDVQEGVLNVNVVLRWEYILGSTLFVVYTRSQTPAQTLLPTEAARLDLGAIRRGPATDAFMVKLSYWWG